MSGRARSIALAVAGCLVLGSPFAVVAADDLAASLPSEIGDMSMSAQAKVLRVLQEGTFERLGSTRTRRVDVRLDRRGAPGQSTGPKGLLTTTT